MIDRARKYESREFKPPSIRVDTTSGVSNIKGLPRDDTKSQLRLDFNRQNVLTGIIYAEILGPPRCKESWRYGGFRK